MVIVGFLSLRSFILRAITLPPTIHSAMRQTDRSYMPDELKTAC